MFKKKISLLICMAMTAGLFAGCGAKKSDTGDIKIGVVLPLTGSVSSFGKSGQNGIKLLEDQVNKAGGINGRNIKFIFEDDEGKADVATTVGTKLISNDNVVAIGLEVQDINELEIGDVIFYENYKNVIFHAAIITSFIDVSGKKEPLISQHSYNQLNENYKKSYDYKKEHFLKIIL